MDIAARTMTNMLISNTSHSVVMPRRKPQVRFGVGGG